MEHIKDLHIRDGDPDPSSRCSEEGRAESGELPEFPRKLPKDLRALFLRTT
jgi:hypothetical protein